MAEPLRYFENEIEWQIHRRCSIQIYLLNLKKFMDEYEEVPDPFWIQLCWMVDAGFSLWRAAFLTDTTRERRIIYQHMKDFITKVIEHNSITFADDHRMRSHVVGYYNANARYRIRRIYESNPILIGQYPSVKDVADLSGDMANRNQRDLLDKYLAALHDIFEWFQHEWKRHRHEQLLNNPRQALARSDAGGH